MKNKRLVLLFVLLTLVLGLGVGAITASARTNSVIVVNSTDGTYNPGDGKCTLREAINNANNDSNVAPWSPDCTAGSGADTIVLGSGLTYTLDYEDSEIGDGPNVLPVITSPITITGNGSVLDGSWRIFQVNASGDLTLNNLTLQHGYSGKYAGGAIWNEGRVNINDSILRDNQAMRFGGAIYNEGTLRVASSQLLENIAHIGDCGPTYHEPPGYGGAIASVSGTVILDSVTLSGNAASPEYPTVNCPPGGGGGGFYADGSDVTISDSTFDGNTAALGAGIAIGTSSSTSANVTIQDTKVMNGIGDYGGGLGIIDYFSSKPIEVLIRNSTFDHNQASKSGGGIYAVGPFATMTVANSTVAYNEAQKGSGIMVDFSDYASSPPGGALATIINTTIRSNVSTADYLIGAQVHARNGEFLLYNTIVSLASGGPNCYTESGGSIDNGKNNLEDGASCGWDSNNGSQSSANPNLGPLQYNGGNTQTMLPLAGSDAIDRGDDTVCNSASIRNRDQRGYVRPAGSHCDVGAAESGAGLPTPTPTVTKTSTPLPTNTPTVTPTTIPGCTTAPAAPTLLKPAQNAALTAQRVNLDWGNVTCATSYSVEVRRNSKAGTVEDSATGLTISRYKTVKLKRGTTYVWRASACNVNGCTASKWQKFSISR